MANVGWLTFTNRTATGAFYDGPKLDLFTGRLSGSVWSANCGWISLSNALAFVQTDTISSSADTDGDGIPDAWEREHFGGLATATAASDFDGDGQSDLGEYLSDTDPRSPASHLRVTYYAAGAGGSPADITWTSQSTRHYRVLGSSVPGPAVWSDVGLGLLSLDAGSTTSRSFSDAGVPLRFYRVESVRPLAP